MKPKTQIPPDFLPLSEIAKKANIPDSTVSYFLGRGLQAYSHPTDKRKRLVSVQQMNAFLLTPKAGRYQGRQISTHVPQKTGHPTKIISAKTAEATSPHAQDIHAQQAFPNARPPTTPNPPGALAPTAQAHPAPLDIRKEPTNLKQGVNGKNPPSQLKRFKKVARKLSFADIPWSLRYLLDRADRLHNEELRKLREECRTRTQALKADEKEFLNLGIVPPAADPAV